MTYEYSKGKSGYYFKSQAGKKTRISLDEYEIATGKKAVSALSVKSKKALPTKGKQISNDECAVICRGDKNIGCMRRCLNY